MYNISQPQSLSTVILKITLTVLFCLFFNSVKGQAGNGCRDKANPSRIYQSNAGYGLNGRDVYRRDGFYASWTSADQTNNPCLKWQFTDPNGCYILDSNGTHTLGDFGTFSGPAGTQNCPIDDSLYLLFIPIGLTAGYFFRKKQYC